MSVLNIWELQPYVQGLIQAHAQFAAKSVVPILDDGTYPKIPGLEKTLRDKGLALIVWRIGSLGLLDTNKTGMSNELLHVAVVIQENESVNRKEGGTGILPEQAYQYVREAVSGKPANTPPGTPILPHEEPFSNLGKVNGVLTIVVNFTKQHRITPI
jgi:hypothetical protein